MTPPIAPEAGHPAPATSGAPAVCACAERPDADRAAGPTVLSKRADFLRAAHGLRHAAPGFHFQARARAATEPASGIRVGYTCSKKVGNAVARNRAKRRLREAARLVLPAHGRDGWDYVLVGKPGATAAREFTALQADLITALARVHRQ